MALRLFLLINFSLLVLNSCSFSNKPREIFSSPYWKKYSPQPYLKKVVFVGNHNFNGAMDSITTKIMPEQQGGKIVSFSSGGIDALRAYTTILRKRYPNELFLLDTGDFLGMSITQNAFEKILHHYNTLKFDVMTLGEQEIGYFSPLNRPNKVLRHFEFPFINTNIINLRSGRVIDENGLMPYKIVEKNDVKVGFIVLTSLKAIPDLMRDQLSAIYFEDPILSILKTSKILQRKGVDLTILVAHIPGNCQIPKNSVALSMDKSFFHQLECPKEDPLAKFIHRLPPNTIDALFSGHSKGDSGFVGSLPVIQSSGHGQFLSRLEILFDTKNKKIVTEQSFIHPATQLCHQFFLNTMDCHLSNKIERPINLLPAKFLDFEVKIPKR